MQRVHIKTILFSIILYVCLTYSVSFSQPVFGAADEQVDTNASSQSITGFTTTGSNIIMVVASGCEDATTTSTVSSIVWDSAGLNESFTQSGAVEEHSAVPINMDVWYLANATAASSKTISITYGGTCDSGIVSIVHYYTNAANAAPEESIKAQATTSSTATDDITTKTTNAMMVSFVEGAGSGTVCDVHGGGSQTERTQVSGSVMGHCSSDEVQPAEGQETMDSTLSSGNTDWIQATISIKEFRASTTGEMIERGVINKGVIVK